VADRVAIIARGGLVTSGPVQEVLAAGRASGLIVKLSDVEAGRRALTDAGITAVPTGDALRVALAPTEAERVTRALAERGLYLSELRPDEVDLETVFLELTRDGGQIS
jgi:ABC-2 type transport system ATP-binding protein